MHRIVTIVFIVVAMLSWNEVHAQKKDKGDIQRYLPTEKIDGKNDNKRKNRPKRKKYKHIVKNKTKNLLYGNPCVLEATHKMGFEYVIQIKGSLGSVNEPRRLWNNFEVNLFLCVTRSPFWRLVLNNKIKKCRIKSGDKTG
ncbi:MAG: hypothetical protein NXI20_27550 [bacterium]|jgi:hypothetical protein|nr:hypothetical protein [bacterium]